MCSKMERCSKPTRILCANCNICVNTLRRYRILDQNTRVCSLLCIWVYPRTITDDDYICEACLDISLAAVNTNMQQNVDDIQAGLSKQGHTNVCLLCGCSIARRQSDKILRNNPSELQQNMINLIKNKIELRQLTTSDKVCHACWLRTKREVQRSNRVDESKSSEGEHQHENISQDNEPCEELPSVVIPRPNITDNIVLPDYRRAANTGNHCVFTNCTNNGVLHGVSDQLRAIIINNHKYYLPKLARVCGDHLVRNSWDSLHESENSVNTFNAEQVQHIFSFVNAYNPALDFENFDEMDERIFVYCVGFSKEELKLLLEEFPTISEIKGGRLGLVSLLIKMRTGDSNERIASLVQKPRRSLEMLMERVREILIQNCARIPGFSTLISGTVKKP